jgi:hypothetical protein
MNAPPSHPGSQTTQLVRADRLPLAVAAIEPPSLELLHRWNSDNLDLLHALAAFEDAPREGRDDHGPLGAEIGKLDAKLRLILRLLGRLTAAGAPLPAECELRFGAGQLEWVGPTVGPAGAHAVAQLYLSPLISEPLRLPGLLVAAPTGATGHEWQCLRYQGLSPLTVDAIEKHIFLYHRRAVARARQQQAS